MKYYIVGGAVRDILMGRPPKDVDLAFDGSVADFLAIFPNAKRVGQHTPTFIANGREYVPLVKNNLTIDLQSRDLTINALALDEQGKFHLHPQAAHDLAQKILRPASPSAFCNDPIRIYRLARFAATFPEFSLHSEALDQAKSVVLQGQHTTLAPERLGKEFLRALASPKPSRFWLTLHSYGALSPWFTEVEPLFANNTTLYPLFDTQTTHASSVRWLLLCAWCTLLLQSMTPTLGHTLATRLRLPTWYIRLAILLGKTIHNAMHFNQLRISEQRDIMHKVHAANATIPYWQCIDILQNSNMSATIHTRLELMQSVRLPQTMHNKGLLSGRLLRALQCRALAKQKKRISNGIVP